MLATVKGPHTALNEALVRQDRLGSGGPCDSASGVADEQPPTKGTAQCVFPA